MESDGTVWDFKHSVECEASRDFAWSFWTDVSNWERIEGQAVEWIRLEGPFRAGARGETKSPGQEPRHWTIVDVQAGFSATIAMKVHGATFLNQMNFESLLDNRTRITQRLSLHGEVPPEMLSLMQTFEATAPEGLAKMAAMIASDGMAGLG